MPTLDYLAEIKILKEKNTKLQADLKEALDVIHKCEAWLSGQILSVGENVRQLDGTIKYERIPTHAQKVLNYAREFIAKHEGKGK